MLHQVGALQTQSQIDRHQFGRGAVEESGLFVQPGALLLQDFVVSTQDAVGFRETDVALADVLVVKQEAFPFGPAV